MQCRRGWWMMRTRTLWVALQVAVAREHNHTKFSEQLPVCGYAGHAGVFSSVDDIATLMGSWLYGRTPSLLNATTIKLWTTEYNHQVSCRALGWSTNDPTVAWTCACLRPALKHVARSPTWAGTGRALLSATRRFCIWVTLGHKFVLIQFVRFSRSCLCHSD
jgi:hypothetical protein